MKPSEPDKIILINKEYISGLTCNDIYTYYMDNKKEILYNTEERPVLLFMKYNFKSDLTITRKTISTDRIILTYKNYEDIINGYTLSISVETANRSNKTNYKIIDIDPKPGTNKSLIQDTLDTLIDYYKKEHFMITNGYNGFHFRIKLSNSQHLIKVKEELLTELNTIFLNKKDNVYSINNNKSKKPINIDLVAMNYRGSLTTPYALNRHGLKCIPIKNFNNLRKKDLLIK